MSGKGNYHSGAHAAAVSSVFNASSLGLSTPAVIYKTTIATVTDVIPLTASGCGPGSIVNTTSSVDVDLVLPLGTAMEAVFGSLQSGDTWTWLVTNLSGYVWTIVGSTGHTVSGTAIEITNGSNVMMMTRKTSTNTYVTRPITRNNVGA